MRIRGIHYDVGTDTLSGGQTRPTLSAEELERDIGVIADDLHANAVRLSGRDPARLAMAARAAAARDLEVWIWPMLVNSEQSEALAIVTASADLGAALLRERHRAVLVVGCELSVFLSGIIPGRDPLERLGLLADPDRLVPAVVASGIDPQAAMRTYLTEACRIARERFDGPLTYAAGTWEPVDWAGFDYIGVDAYRESGNAATFANELRALVATGRPLVITEFGCAAFRGASGLGGRAWMAVDRSVAPARLRPGTTRDEAEQADEVGGLLDTFKDVGVDGAFVYTLIAPTYPADDQDAARDLDAASYALLRSWPDGRITPKLALREVATRYASWT